MTRPQYLPFLALLIASPFAAAQEPLDLKQSLPIGKKITQTTAMTQNMSMDLAGQAIKTQMVMNMAHTMAITAHEGGGKKASLSYDSAAMKMNMGEIAMDFDSSSTDPSNPFKDLIGKEVTVIFDANDEVVDVEGLDGLVGDAGAAGQMVQQMVNPEQMKNLMSQGMLQGLPDKPVAPGDSWPFNMDIPLPQNLGSIEASGNYTFKELSKIDGAECAVIEVNGKIAGELKANEDGAPGMKMTFENASYTGTVYFDNALGMPRKNDLKIKITMKMSAPGQTIEAHTEQSIVNTITKVEDL